MLPSDMKRAARYMGAPLNEETNALLQKAAQIASAAIQPRHVVRKVFFKQTSNGIWADELLLPGQSIEKHLDGCQEGFLLAATLGAQIDTVIRREGLVSQATGTAISACASVVIEDYLDALCPTLAPNLTSRFSPGYGDLPLNIQQAFLKALQAQRIGLYTTESFMMVPEKSVTAIVGVTDNPLSICISHCARCENLSCPYREV